MHIRAYTEQDLPEMAAIWNAVVEAADAFPQSEPLPETEAAAFFAGQSYTGVAEDASGAIVGLYILHPNNVGRCGHIANASFAVDAARRGEHIGEALVRDCLAQGKRLGFRILQFNAVVATNTAAIRLYEKLGFHKIGMVKDGFMKKDGAYTDIILYYIEL